MTVGIPQTERMKVYQQMISAVCGQRVSEVIMLVKQGASINFGGRAGWTPMHEAASLGHDKVVESLLSLNANPNAITEKGTTPVYWAAKGGYIRTVNMLLLRGADPLMAGVGVMNSLDVAIEKGHQRIIERIRKHIASMKTV